MRGVAGCIAQARDQSVVESMLALESSSRSVGLVDSVARHEEYRSRHNDDAATTAQQNEVGRIFPDLARHDKISFLDEIRDPL